MATYEGVKEPEERKDEHEPIWQGVKVSEENEAAPWRLVIQPRPAAPPRRETEHAEA